MIEPLSLGLDEACAPAAPPPPRRPVVRTSLVHRLAGAVEMPVVAVVAPAGYGKTTLLGQWAERDPRSAAWFTLEPEHDDADVLDSTLAPWLARPDVLAVVDDIHVLRSPEAVDALQRLLAAVPSGTTVALAGRREPPRLLPRLRAAGRLLELGPEELALTEREAQSLLRHAGVLLPDRDAALLERRTEGWPAMLFLAALAVRAGVSAPTFRGDDRFVADYLETEHLTELTPAQRRFATHTSVLSELSGEECDALLERSDSGRVLETLERKGLVVPLDHCRCRYRYRHLVRDVLGAELERSDPARARSLHRSAAELAERRGETEEALRHAVAAGCHDRVGALASRIVLDGCAGCRFEDVEHVLSTLEDEPAVRRQPDLSVAASWLHALRARPADSRRCADDAVRSLAGDDPRLRLLNALRCRDGAEQMLDDAAAALPLLQPGSTWRPAALLARGVARLLSGDGPRADADLADAVEASAAAGAADVRVLALCLRAFLAGDREAYGESAEFAEEAAALTAAVHADPSALQLLVAATSARASLRENDREGALDWAGRAETLLPFMSYAAPWLSVLAALELVHVQLAVGEPEAARELLRRVGDIFRVRPRLGILVQRAAELDRRARALDEPEGRWATSLTPAEIRLLPLLATYLSFREIGAQLFVSRNTVKTQAISIYRKFGVCSRSEAIARARDLGLIDDAALPALHPMRTMHPGADGCDARPTPSTTGGDSPWRI